MEEKMEKLAQQLQVAAKAAKDQAPETCPYKKVARIESGNLTPAEKLYFQVQEDLKNVLTPKTPK